MSSKRTSSSSSSNMTEEELKNLVLKLQDLLPRPNQNHEYSTVPTGKILKETCRYIKKLRREVDKLSERLSKQIESMDSDHNGAVDSEFPYHFLRR